MFLTKTFTAGNETYDEFPFLGELIMEAFLIENPKALNLGAKEFEEAKILGHQIPLEKGSKKKDGRIDILAAYGNRMAIIELKKGQVDEKAKTQLEEYLQNCSKLESHKIEEPWLKQIELAENSTILDYCKSINKNIEEIEWIGVLAGTSIDPNLALELREGQGYSFQNDDSEYQIGAITIKRYLGEKNRIYTITDSFFPEKVSTRDYSKYSIVVNGDIKHKNLSKRHLALKLVQLFVKQPGKENITVNELIKNIFPNALQGTRTISPYEEAKDGRAFKAPQYVIKLADGNVCVSNQWSKENIPRMITRAEKLITGLKVNQN